MSGLLRGRGGSRAATVYVPIAAALQGLDKAGLLLYRRPGLRVLFVAYVLALHPVLLVYRSMCGL